MDKGSRGGKYPKVDAFGYYGRNDAGIKRKSEENSAGMKREFTGSRTKEYTFFNSTHGTHTITATSFADALRIAKSMGFTLSDYIKR